MSRTKTRKYFSVRYSANVYLWTPWTEGTCSEELCSWLGNIGWLVCFYFCGGGRPWFYLVFFASESILHLLCIFLSQLLTFVLVILRLLFAGHCYGSGYILTILAEPLGQVWSPWINGSGVQNFQYESNFSTFVLQNFDNFQGQGWLCRRLSDLAFYNTYMYAHDFVYSTPQSAQPLVRRDS